RRDPLVRVGEEGPRVGVAQPDLAGPRLRPCGGRAFPHPRLPVPERSPSVGERVHRVAQPVCVGAVGGCWRAGAVAVVREAGEGYDRRIPGVAVLTAAPEGFEKPALTWAYRRRCVLSAASGRPLAEYLRCMRKRRVSCTSGARWKLSLPSWRWYAPTNSVVCWAGGRRSRTFR